MQNLVIVESPAKARTLQRFLGSSYQIEASMGHIRDLPKSEFGVDIEKDFEPQYVIPRDKRKRVNELKKTAGKAKTLWLATDPDREGEAIAWHLEQLAGGKDVKRVIFHEITEEAIKEAFAHPREIDLKLVDAQQARRVLDRLVGYKLSPLLWKKVKRGLSAGRVQSVALRLVVEREREIGAFKTEEYWIIEALLEVARQGTKNRSREKIAHLGFVSRQVKTQDTNKDVRSTASHFSVAPDLTTSDAFLATLIEKDGKKLSIKNKKEADLHLKNLEKADYVVSKITKKEVRRYPYPPFTTSTLQQTASNRLGFSAKKTMMLAQALYEHGFITYMRTDSVNLATSSISAAREYISQNMGKEYLPSAPRLYKAKSKNVQEAHEAIRSTKVGVKSEELRVQSGFNKDHVRLYELIWKRFVACQMKEAVMDQTTIDSIASARAALIASLQNDKYLLRASGSVIKFDGWLKLYGKSVDEEDPSTSSGLGKEAGEGKILPELAENDPLKLIQLIQDQHFTEPPPRYTEASLIKKLEELGIGRPSTYAPILSTITDRFYVERVERKFVPTALGFAVTDFLMKYFSDVIDYSFTAQMEDELDEISRGERQWRPTIKTFYTPFEKKLEETGEKAEKVKLAVEYAGKKCPECGKELIVRVGRFGKFLACSSFPDCKYTEAIEEIINAKCPQDGGDMVVRKTKRGKIFYGCKNWPKCKYASWTKPKSGKK